MTCQIFNRCPQMDAVRTNYPNVRMAQELFTDVVIILDGQRLHGWLKFPFTKILKTGLLRAVVDPCTAHGMIIGHGKIWVALDAERVLGPEAFPVAGRGGCYLADGTMGTIDMVYGRVLAMPEGDGDWLVGAVNAEGTVTF